MEISAFFSTFLHSESFKWPLQFFRLSATLYGIKPNFAFLKKTIWQY